MKAWNKKLMTLACATCLTVGMGAVACADTVDLGYGQYANTSSGVKATVIDVVPTNANMRNAEQNKKIQKLNNEFRNEFSKKLKSEISLDTPDFTGDTVDGYSLYQLSGDSSLGHHTAWLLTYNVDKDFINYLNSSTDAKINSILKEKGAYNETTKQQSKPYSKSDMAGYLKIVPSMSLQGPELEAVMKAYNESFHARINRDIDKTIAMDTTIAPHEKEQAGNIAKFALNHINVGVTSMSLAPYESKFGSLVSGSIRGNVAYDGFKLPGAMSAYVVPTDEGLTIQVLASEDTSYAYWNNELQHMYGLTAIKGGK